MAWPFSKTRNVDTTVSVVERPTSIPKVSRRIRNRGHVARRSYDAGETDRFSTNWTTTPLCADQVIDRNQRILVARSREQSAKNDYMKAYLRLVEQNLVGEKGFILQAQAKDPSGKLDTAANDALEAWWRKWQRAENCDITGRRNFRRTCKIAAKTAAKDGEFMIREITGSAAPMGYALQLLDPQRCPVDYSVDKLSGGRFIRQGIEFSAEGRPLAYYFQTSDPAHSGYAFNGSSLQRIPADEIIHGFLEDIVGQRRGIPWAATSLWRLNQLSGFEKSALTNARMGASVGGFLEWEKDEGPDDHGSDISDGDGEFEDDEELYIEPEGGVFQELPPGLKHKAFQSQYPSGEFTPFHKAMVRGAGAGMGVSYVSLANDLEGVNFSSIRQGVIDEREHWMDLQEWLIEILVDRVYQRALKAALLRGLVKKDGIRLRPEKVEKYLDVFWQAKRWAWVDPLKDIKAETEAMANLLTAPSDIIRRKGQDPQTVWKTIGNDIASMRDADIPDEIIAALLTKSGPLAAPQTQPKPEGGDDEGAN